MESFRGKLLLATPELMDSNFHRSVVLVIEHNNDGAIGVVLNRQTEITSTEVLPKWVFSSSSDSLLFWGGPVQQESLLALGLLNQDSAALQNNLLNRITVIDLNQEIIDSELFTSARLYSGYSGWSPGQLNAEISSGGWIVAEANDNDPFVDQPTDLWSEVLERQEGFISRLAQYPDDPRMN
ncbi:MAG: hypothetical protein CL517_02515 [Actinobacteria bacterium]|nr:hypothetical protein [Actinomycetota bacterium]|tara:strand:+ start:215 stop:760 length:546 start_codon:yes stop_codon:yes gene_type:complete